MEEGVKPRPGGQVDLLDTLGKATVVERRAPDEEAIASKACAEKYMSE